MIKVETFLYLEASLTNKIMKAVNEATQPLYVKVKEHIAAKNYVAAKEMASRLSLMNVYFDMEPTLIYHTHLAMLFGASRLTEHPGESVVGLGLEKMVVQQIVQGFMSVFGIGQSYLQGKLLQLIAEIEQGEVEVQKAEKRKILKDFDSFMDKEGKSFFNIVSSLHTSRVASYGFTAEANVLGITEYEISEQLDSRICPVCTKMHGRKFPVKSAREFLSIVVRMTDPESLKFIQPWPKHNKSFVDGLDGMSAEELISKNWHVPPFHPRPVAEDTEFLGKDGWKLVKEAKVGDLAFSLNPDTCMVEWVPVVGVVVAGKAPNGRMVHFLSQNADLLVTEYHEQPYLQYLNKGSQLAIKPARELLAYSKVTIPRGGDWVGGECGLSTEMVQLLALWISDGSVVVKGPDSYYVTIATKKYSNLAKELLEAVTGKIAYIRHSSVECNDTELGKYLHDVVGTGCLGKRIPEVIMGANQEVITLFLNTYLIGDGSICEAGGVYGKSVNKVFYTVSPILAAQIGELIVKAGGFPSYRMQDNSLNPQFIAGREVMSNYEVYRIRWCISAGSTFGKNGKGIMKFVPYDGDTFCLTLERNHIFYSRRNGKCIWTGNCRGVLMPVGSVLPLDGV